MIDPINSSIPPGLSQSQITVTKSIARGSRVNSILKLNLLILKGPAAGFDQG